MKKKHILGLDLGTTSIGHAQVTIDEDDFENSSIDDLGVRIVPLSTDETQNFYKLKSITSNADRTHKRSARKTLNRYQDRRANLLEILKDNHIIDGQTVIAEMGEHTTHQTLSLRAKAAKEEVSLQDFAKILLIINKKRGYKSSRKVKAEDDGKAIDGMAIAQALYEENITPGQYVYQRLKEGKKSVPDFYRSDLNLELERIWEFQKQFHPEILTDSFRKLIGGKGQTATSAIIWNTYGFNKLEIKANRDEKKLKAYQLRNDALSKELSKEEVAYVIVEINNNINNSSGYLGEISDRSKELYFNKITVGEFLYQNIQANPHYSTRRKVFYRMDYLNEFEQLWAVQSKFHKELTEALKSEIRDVVIFYQRKLKSQKSKVSFCEFENFTQTQIVEGVKKEITFGSKVIPKSSPLFQEFKIWQNLGAIKIQDLKTKKADFLDLESKKLLFEELNVKGNLSKKECLTLLGRNDTEYNLNFKTIEGNRTYQAIYKALQDIMILEGNDLIDFSKLKAAEIRQIVDGYFKDLQVNTSFLDFDTSLVGQAFEQQSAYQFWHLLYSYEEDNSPSGNDILYRLLNEKYGFDRAHAPIIANISLQDDYGSLSAKAIRKIIPFMMENTYDAACSLAGYNHSSSLTKEENENRVLLNLLPLLKKGSLRNPVVEKILNQMVNVINTIIEDRSEKDEQGNIKEYFHFDEIRIELARDLKKNAKERAEASAEIDANTKSHELIIDILKKEFQVKNPTRNDIIRYKLYQELKSNGYKTLYSDTYIAPNMLFSKEIDIEHIIPKAKLFDDSFSNKTLELREINLKKGDDTAIDFVGKKYHADGLERFLNTIEMLYQINQKSKDSKDGISRAKYLKLQKKLSDIGEEGFIDRDLRNTQYIARKARQMLLQITRNVISTTGSITNRLREDWDLVNVMQELNLNKYKVIGLTEMVEKKDGSFKERIVDWTKRNDHRHHAMDALTVAFTSHNHIQYLNNLNARTDDKSEKKASILAIEDFISAIYEEKNGNKKRKFKAPIANFRTEAKKYLENVLISFKTKNKVVTKNTNITKVKGGVHKQVTLTPRGQLHNETVYGKITIPMPKKVKIGGNFDAEMIQKVCNPTAKKVLLERLLANNNDSKKAFTGANSLSKKPIYLDEAKKIILAETVKIMDYLEVFTIRKDINKDLKIDKVIDQGVKTILEKRLKEFNNNANLAFGNLDENPIWLNKEKGISIKRVTITGVSNAVALHHKKDQLGNDILDSNGNKIANSYVNTSNNHHVAIYEDEKGNLQENVISFYETVARAKQGLDIVDKLYNQHLGWKFLFTMKQNECFIFPNESTGFNPKELDLLDPKNASIISPNLFRVQQISTKNYLFAHHLETKAINGDVLKIYKELSKITYNSIRTPSNLQGIIKVRINHLGKIIQVGEY